MKKWSDGLMCRTDEVDLLWYTLKIEYMHAMRVCSSIFLVELGVSEQVEKIVVSFIVIYYVGQKKLNRKTNDCDLSPTMCERESLYK
jgi:hypothetical protein